MPKTILAVDDSLLTHEMYKLFLHRFEDLRIVTAMNGVEALDKLASEKDVDLILLDITMPHMNGVEVLERLQQDPAHRSIPVIIITGSDEDASHALQLGAKAYMKKPFRADELRDLVEKVMAG